MLNCSDNLINRFHSKLDQVLILRLFISLSKGFLEVYSNILPLSRQS